MFKSMYWAGKFLREAGIQIDRAGMALQGDMAFKEPRTLLTDCNHLNFFKSLDTEESCHCSIKHHLSERVLGSLQMHQ